MNVFTAISQFDYDMKKERQRKGIELARSEGKYKGRKAIEVDEERFELLYNAWQSWKSTTKIMMNELNLKPATFWRKVKDTGKSMVLRKMLLPGNIQDRR